MLQDENGRLKTLVAELTVDRARLQDVLRNNWQSPHGAALWLDTRAARAELASGMLAKWFGCREQRIVPEHPRSADSVAIAHEGVGADAHSLLIPQDPGIADP